MLSLLHVMAAHHALILSDCLPTLHDLERERSVCVCVFQLAHVFLQPAHQCLAAAPLIELIRWLPEVDLLASGA